MGTRQTFTKSHTIRYASIGALVLWLVVLGTALSQQSDPAVNATPVVLTDEQSSYRLGKHLWLLEDPGRELTIEDVTSPQYQAQFLPSHVDTPNLGFTDSAYWVRLPLENESQTVTDWLLELGFANLQYVDLYSPRPNGDGFDVKQTGSFRSPATRDLQHEHIVFDLTIPSESRRTFYLRFQNGASMTLPLSLWTPAAFFVHAQQELAIRTVYFGALIALLAYNIFLAFSIRERSYFYLTLVVALLIVFEAIYSGYTEAYLIPRLYFLKDYYHRAMFSLVFASMVLFGDSFLELKSRAPRLHRMSIASIAVWLALLLLIPFTSYMRFASIAVPYGILSTGFIFVAGMIAWTQGFPYARFYMIGWAGMLVALVLVLLVRLGLLPSAIVGEHSYQVGLVWMAVWWSLALADRVNLLRTGLQKSEHHLSQILEGLPLGVVMYGKDQKPSYVNKRVVDILANPERNISPDISAGRTLGEAMGYYSFRVAGSDQAYPVERFPVYRALQGEFADADDIEADLVDYRVPLEIWASPIKDEMGHVDSAVVAFQDVRRRKKMEEELAKYRVHLENLVEQRTEELIESNTLLNHEIAERRYLADVQAKLITWLSEVNEVHEMVGGGALLPEAVGRLLVGTSNFLGASSAMVGFWDNQQKQLDVLTCLRCETDQPLFEEVAVACDSTSSLGQLISKGEICILSADFDSAPLATLRPFLDNIDVSSVILAPIQLQPQTKGLLGLGLAGENGSFTMEDLALFDRMRSDIADLSAHARLYETTRELAATEERNRLARDLHDSVTQVLFSASLLAEVLPQIWRRDPEQAVESLASLKRLTRGALSEMRTLLLELRPAAVVKTPLPELLSQLTEAVTGRTDLPFRLRIQRTSPLPEDAHVAIYRIAQESLNNVVKHAQAGRVDVSLSSFVVPSDAENGERTGVTLTIADDGIGFDQAQLRSEHLGLSIMVERAADIGADLSIISEVGIGTTVTVAWPGDSGDQDG